MNIILLISDTFRRDHLGCYGHPYIQTPHLNRFAEQACVFDQAYAASFPTMPNRADVMTGKNTFTYLGWNPLSREEVILPMVLADAGYSTMGVVDTPFYIRNGYGYDVGFDDFVWIRGQDYASSERENAIRGRVHEEQYFAPMTCKAAEQWLEHHYEEKFFLLVDTWDPHEPWEAPAHYVDKYLKDYEGPSLYYPCYWDYEEAGVSQEYVKHAHAHYCAKITMVDRAVGRLLERVESLDLLEETLIIFTSDHGHYFGEHGLFGKARQKGEDGVFYPSTVHGSNWYRSPLYDELTRVPMIMRGPGIKIGRRNGFMNHADLMPTILEFAGAEIPKTVQGKSLAGALRGEGDIGREFAVTSWPLYNAGKRIRVVDDLERRIAEPLPSTITDGEWTLLYAAEGETVELYHTLSDPEQRHNVFVGNESVAHDLHAKFVGFLEEMGTEEQLLAPRRKI